MNFHLKTKLKNNTIKIIYHDYHLCLQMISEQNLLKQEKISFIFKVS